MISTSLRAVLVLSLVAPLASTERAVARSQGQRPLAVSISPGVIRPGEVIRIDVRGAADTPVTVTVFGQTVPFSFDVDNHMWTGLAGVDVETKPGRYSLRVRQTNSPRTTHTVRVLPKQFRVRRLRVAEGFVNPPAEALQQIASDSKLLAQTYAQITPRQWQDTFRLPVEGKPTSNFGTRSYYNGERRSPHAGIDFTSEPGTPVAATNRGTVALAAALYFTGNTVIIDHGAQLFSVYAHLSVFHVKAGEAVTPETIIGLVGATGRVTGPHLHWSVRLNGARVDPLSLIAATQVR